MKQSVTWKIGGEAGFGIMSSGLMFCRTFSRSGYHVFATNEYPSLIRGGHNLITVRVSPDEFHSLNQDLHVLVALNKQTVELHKSELSADALVVFDPKDYEWQTGELPKSVKLVALPMSELVKDHGGSVVMRNTVALGASVALLGGEFVKLESVISDQFAGKGAEVVRENVEIAKSGYEYVKKFYAAENSMYITEATPKEPQLVINVSETIGVAAVRAGLKFAAIYPMTPINSLISYLADHAKEVQVVYKQPEDEIAGINMAIGASVAGVRSMVATSGGGFALMVEGLSLAGMIEAPLVIDLGMRVGPATGMPTWTEQGELQFAIHAGHGEFAKIVLAPADAREAFDLTVEAFNLADRYQVQVIILTDKYLNESEWCVGQSHFQKEIVIDRGKLLSQSDLDKVDEFRRYSLAESDGVSPRSKPGLQKGFYINNSYEHDELGLLTEDSAKREAMAQKRLKKFTAMEKDILPPQVFGDAEADYTFVTWGSSRGPVLEAMKLLQAKGYKVQVVNFSWIYPFPTGAATPVLQSARRLVAVEQNGTGQLAALIREKTGIEIKEKLLKYSGRPFYPEEIVEQILTLKG